jgi:heat-inducible transcriptional repressor
MTKRTPYDLNERDQLLLKALVECYIHDGQPVGSRTLARQAGIRLSPATIRNVMVDLEELGLVLSPHTSAGRVPTALGFRLFVDTLLRVRPMKDAEMERLRRRLPEADNPHELAATASSMLSGVTHFVGLVTVPKRGQVTLQQLDFVALSGNRVLAILVFSDAEVQNRIIHTQRQYRANDLLKIANYLNERFSGKTLAKARAQLLDEMRDARTSLDRLMADAIRMAERALVPGEDEDDVVMTGQTNLMGLTDLPDLNQLRRLFEAFNRKQEILTLLGECISAQGVRIYIGEESGYRAFDGVSLVTAPYSVEDDVVGVLGVIGPTRMRYDRVVSIVDATARIFGKVLGRS